MTQPVVAFHIVAIMPKKYKILLFAVYIFRLAILLMLLHDKYICRTYRKQEEVKQHYKSVDVNIK
jgi:hypothetical protein